MLNLSNAEKESIRASWSKVMSSPDTGANLFYSRLFETNPETRPLFKQDIGVQGRKLIETINVVVDNLDEDLSDVVLQLGVRHQGYQVVEADYAKVGAALIWMLEAMGGGDFDPASKSAWANAYTQISTQMLTGYA